MYGLHSEKFLDSMTFKRQKLECEKSHLNSPLSVCILAQQREKSDLNSDNESIWHLTEIYTYSHSNLKMTRGNAEIYLHTILWLWEYSLGNYQ